MPLDFSLMDYRCLHLAEMERGKWFRFSQPWYLEPIEGGAQVNSVIDWPWTSRNSVTGSLYTGA